MLPTQRSPVPPTASWATDRSRPTVTVPRTIRIQTRSSSAFRRSFRRTKRAPRGLPARCKIRWTPCGICCPKNPPLRRPYKTTGIPRERKPLIGLKPSFWVNFHNCVTLTAVKITRLLENNSLEIPTTRNLINYCIELKTQNKQIERIHIK